MAVKRTPEQEEVVKNRGGALLVSAAAGVGKDPGAEWSG